jgi:hypothetical protein
MAHHETTVDVPVTAEAAFAHLADRARLSSWDPSIVESERTDTGPLGEGSRSRLVVAFFGRRIELDEVIERYDSPHELAVAGRNKNVESRTVYRVEPSESGATITTVSDLKLKGALRLFDKGLQVTFTNIGDKAADGLRRTLDR